MKKLFLNKSIKAACITLCAGTLLISSCKSKLEDLYLNPDGFTTPTIEGFYTNVQSQLGVFRYSYGEMYHTFNAFNPMLGSGGYANDGTVTAFSWLHGPYGDAYGKLRSIAAMQDAYKKLSESDKKEYEIFMWTGNVIKDYIFYNLTDACGDVPYTEALQASSLNYFPKFDKQKDIYLALLADLKDVSTKLKTFTLGTSVIQLQFSKNDIWFAGNIAQWRVFVNSLRMRLAMRLTNVEAALAKSTIKEVLDEGVYANTRATTVTLVDKHQNQALELLIFRSMQERRAMLWAPQNMLKVMRVAGQPEDPRIKVLFQPDKDGNYTAMPTEGPDVSAISSQITSTDLSKTFPSIYNRTTFEMNFGMPYQVITSSEMNLIKAEAALRWPDLGIVAADAYKTAIQHSIDIYYEINAGATNTTYSGFIPASKPTKPTQAEIDLFLAAKVLEFTTASANEKLGLVYDQKYVHFNMLKPYELWADTRRLFKELGARVRKGPSNVPLMERTVYPTSEELNNGANFLAVKAANNYTTPVWWTGR